MGKEIKEGFALEVVSVRLVRDAPILSGEAIGRASRRERV